RKALDEEDVALSAFRSVCQQARGGDLGNINDRFELLRLMTCVTGRKTINHVKNETRQKRGSGKVRSESEFEAQSHASATQSKSLDQHSSDAGDPAKLLEYEEGFRSLLDALEDPVLETVALLRLEGYAVAEIAEKVGCAKRSVERRLNLIRQVWTSEE
ncbi:MAG: ECF-type sigma factor, partial [Planctomycetota bacterium]